ncbi:hypothetical protein KKF61_00070 [Patescibacteria group bacterium]|nr:hypothetical protein [Patescibacteria group bacterium]MBU0964053.1 hypothetical protein [Patescibacteria group bacterium]
MRKYLPLSISLVLIIFGIAIALGIPQPAKTDTADCGENNILFEIISRDAQGVIVPGVKYHIYQQNRDPYQNPYLGSRVASGTTDEGGQAATCINKSSGVSEYAVKLYQYADIYGYRSIWNEDMAGSAGSEGVGGYYLCDVYLSYMHVTFRDAAGNLLKDVNFDIYVQDYDADGTPIVSEDRLNQEKLIYSNYTTGATGETKVYLASKQYWPQGGVYVFRIHGTGTSYIYLWGKDIPNGLSNDIEYRLGTIKVVQEDAYGRLLYNRKFSIYNQTYDAHGNPAYGDLIANDLDVGTLGYYDVYLPAGDYAFRFPSSINNDYFTKWEITSRDGAYRRFVYRLSILRTHIYNDQHQLLTNQSYKLGLQGTDAAGNPGVQSILTTSNTEDLGYDELYLVPRKYALLYNDDIVYNVEVFENQPTIIDYPWAMSMRPAGGELALTTPLANETLTLRPLPAADVRGISIRKQNVGTPFQVRANEELQPYTVVFFYNKDVLRTRGIDGNKLRIAFYNSRTGRWSLVGNIYYDLWRLSATVRDPGIYTLIEIKMPWE